MSTLTSTTGPTLGRTKDMVDAHQDDGLVYQGFISIYLGGLSLDMTELKKKKHDKVQPIHS